MGKGLSSARTLAGSRGSGIGRRERSLSRGGRCCRRGRRMGRSWGSGLSGKGGVLRGGEAQVGFPLRLASAGSTPASLRARCSRLPRALRRPGRDHGEAGCVARSQARVATPSERPRVAGRRGRAAGTQGSFGVGTGPGAFSLALLSSADVETLARARAGGGRLGPRRGR